MYNNIFKKALDGVGISSQEALSLLMLEDKDLLYSIAEQVTRKYCGNRFDCCSIINAKSGNCSEDCKWCAQSSFYSVEIEKYGLLPIEKILEEALYNQKQGIKKFSLVSSGRKPSLSQLKIVCDYFKELKSKTDLKLCASLGLLNKQELLMLKDSGVETYHCNLETSPGYFQMLCTTHTIEDKIETINSAVEIGMSVCSGGIIGMGESMEQRIELAVTLRDLNIKSIPINILVPIKGTPLYDTQKISDEEILTTIALFRLINPYAYLRFSGGRGRLPASVQEFALKIGINAAIVGDLLTTIGSSFDQDVEMIKRGGYVIN